MCDSIQQIVRVVAGDHPRLFVPVYLACASRNILILPSWPILYRLRQMRELDSLASRQVGNRPRELQHRVKRPGRELTLRHRCADQGVPRLVQLAILAHIRRARVGVASNVYPSEAVPLPLPRRLHSRPYRLRRQFLG